MMTLMAWKEKTIPLLSRLCKEECPRISLNQRARIRIWMTKHRSKNKYRRRFQLGQESAREASLLRTWPQVADQVMAPWLARTKFSFPSWNSLTIFISILLRKLRFIRSLMTTGSNLSGLKMEQLPRLREAWEETQTWTYKVLIIFREGQALHLHRVVVLSWTTLSSLKQAVLKS